MRASPLMERLKATKLVQRRLEQGYPRLQMSFLVLLTGASGFLASYILLHLGFGAMGMRYFISMCVAYAVFFLLLWIWLKSEVDEIGGDEGDTAGMALDTADI